MSTGSSAFSPRSRVSQALDLPSSLVCPLSLQLFEDPVTVEPENPAQGANTFERQEIQAWFRQGRQTDPLTNLALKSQQLTPNLAVRKLVEEFRDKHRELAAALKDLDDKYRIAQVTAESSRSAVVPLRFLCKITNAIMKIPVRAKDGFVYDEAAFLAHVRDCRSRGVPITSPTTKDPMEESYEDGAELAKEIKQFLATTFNARATPELANGSSMINLSSLFSALDDLQDVLVETLGSWEPPFLVVFGAESVGKSSLLQRLSLLPFFPTDKVRCTKMPLKVKIRRATSPGPAYLQIYDVKNKTYTGEPKTISLQTSEAEIAEQTREFLNRAGQEDKICMDFELHVTAISVTLPPMNLVDLPGIISIDPVLKEKTEELLKRYVQASSKDIFLAVSSANSAPSDWTSIRLVREHGLVDRSVGVITNCDRLKADDDEDQLLRSWLSNQAGEGFMPLEPHGYVAVVNEKCGKVKQGESYADWMRRRAENELRVFNDNLQMQDCVEEGKASMQALLDRIGRMYSWHVVHNWLPLTAKKLMQVWHGCCEELTALGLPRSSGDLEGEALQRLKAAALAEVRSRLEPVVSRTRSFFHEEIAKPMQEYLFKQLGDLEEEAVNVLELDLHLRNASHKICQGLPLKPLPATFADELRKMMSGLLDRKEDSAFKLERLPGLAQRLQQNLHAQMPKLDVDKVRAQITEYLKTALTPEVSAVLKANAAEFPAGTLKMKVDKATVSMVCLNFLGKAFEAISTDEALEERILVPALKDQEQEAGHHARERIYARMELCAKSLLKLADMHRKHTDSEDGDLLEQWWPFDALGPVCLTLQGNRREDSGFRDEACNLVATAMFKRLLQMSGSRAKFKVDVRSSLDPAVASQAPAGFGSKGALCEVQDVDGAKGFRAVEFPAQLIPWTWVEVTNVDSVLLDRWYEDLVAMLRCPGSESVRLELLFRASRDGHTPQAFHQRCDNQGPTVVVAKSQGGHLFGGFTEVSWDSSNQWKQCGQSFLFRLSGPGNVQPSKHPIKKNGNVNGISCINTTGPAFGGSDGVNMQIVRYQDQMSKVHFPNFGSSYTPGNLSCLAEGPKDVLAIDYEVFRVSISLPYSLLLDVDSSDRLLSMLPPGVYSGAFRLLFRASRDGHTPQAFHQRCDNQGPTVVVSKSQGGHLFGGFTEVAWDSSGQWKHSGQSFLFRLSGPGGIQPSKHPIYQNHQNGVRCRPNEFPQFGSDMTFSQNGGQTKASFNDFGNTYNRQTASGADGKVEYLAEARQDVTVADFEVFQCQFEFSDSALLGPDAYVLISMLPPGYSSNNRRLLFRASRDGNTPQAFHQRCDNRGPTVVVAKSQGGHLFGGFTEVPWDSSNQWKFSYQSFLFRLSGPGGVEPSKHPIYQNHQNGIYCYPASEPAFGGGHDMLIQSSRVTFNIGNTYNPQSVLGNGGSFNCLAESKSAQLVDYEVFALQ